MLLFIVGGQKWATLNYAFALCRKLHNILDMYHFYTAVKFQSGSLAFASTGLYTYPLETVWYQLSRS